MEHYELVQEMGSVERMATQERLKHARKRRSQQMKRWAQYERHLEKESTKKKKNPDKQQPQKPIKKNKKGNVKFVSNIALLEAAARNDLNEVKRMLESGVSPDGTNADGLTALHQCCIDDSEDMMKLLLDYNANVNAYDSEMWTPLHAAATCGHMMLCKLLIDNGAELLAVNADGNMPYDICEDEITLDHIETEMANRGVTQEQIDTTRLASEHRMLADLKDFAGKGGNLETVDHIGATLLHIAAANGYMEVAEFLLDNHVSVDARDYEWWQPVHAAAFWAQQEILEMLVECGADLDSKTKNGETPFDLCEEPDMKQKILDMKDEIENKRSIRQQRQGSQRKQRISSRNTSMRRSSLRGDKSQLFKKEHKEEALHFGLSLMQDDDCLMEADEEYDSVPSTDLDEVKIVINSEDSSRHSSPTTHDMVDSVDGAVKPTLPPSSITTITVNNSVSKPPVQSAENSSPHITSPQSLPPANSLRVAPQPSPRNQKRDAPPVVAARRETTLDVGPYREPTASDVSSKEPSVCGESRSTAPASSGSYRELSSVDGFGREPPPADRRSWQESVVDANSTREPYQGTDSTRKPSADGLKREPFTVTETRRDPPPNVVPRRQSPPDVGPRRRRSTDTGLRRAQNTSGPTAPSLQDQPRQPFHPAVTEGRRLSGGTTLSDLKRHRSNSRESLLDLAVQDMFLDRVQGGRQRSTSSVQGNSVGGNSVRVVGRGKPKNGYNNNDSTMQYSASDGQLRRYVAPTNSPAVGADKSKQNCCVIL